jgi:hypothetical protein
MPLTVECAKLTIDAFSATARGNIIRAGARHATLGLEC